MDDLVCAWLGSVLAFITGIVVGIIIAYNLIKR